MVLGFAHTAAAVHAEPILTAMTTAGLCSWQTLLRSFVLIAAVASAETEIISLLRTQAAFKERFASSFFFRF